MKNIFKKYRVLICFTCISLLIVNCDQALDPDPDVELENYKLTARPSTPTEEAVKGLNKLELNEDRQALLYIPESYSKNEKIPVMVCLHGAGGSASNWGIIFSWAEEKGVVLVAIDLYTRAGSDVDFIDKALHYTFERINVDQSKLALVGYSAGANLTLSLGPTNGNIFSHLIAFAPSRFEKIDPLVGKPKIYISHGTYDEGTPISHVKGNIVPTLIHYGYDVTFVEYPGGHGLPFEVLYEPLNNWFLENNNVIGTK